MAYIFIDNNRAISACCISHFINYNCVYTFINVNKNISTYYMLKGIYIFIICCYYLNPINQKTSYTASLIVISNAGLASNVHNTEFSILSSSLQAKKTWYKNNQQKKHPVKSASYFLCKIIRL